MRHLLLRVFTGLTVAALVLSVGDLSAEASGLTPEERNRLPHHFGFAPLEIIKIDDGITQLRTADFNNDGARDLVVVNNKKSTIEVFLQRMNKADAVVAPQEVNELVDHWRFERKKASVTWQISCLKVADVTGDGNADILFFGEPNELVILPGMGDGTFDAPQTRRVRDGMTLASGLDVADMNGDKRADVVLLAEKAVLIFYQKSGGGLDNPKRFTHALENPLALKAVDLDGDGLDDLVLVTDEESYPLRIRMQERPGEFGAVQRVRLPALRSAKFAATHGSRAADLFGVERISGRLRRWSISPNNRSESDDNWAVLQLPIPGSSDGTGLPLSIGDVDGDRLLDVVTTNADAAQMVLFAQKPARGLVSSQSFGGQTDLSDLRCYDSDGDGVAEVYVCSPEERTIARSTFSNGRLSFPSAISTFEKPFALDVGRPDPDADATIAYVSRDEDSVYWLTVQSLTAKSSDDPAARIELEDMDEPPSGVRWIDANRDGRLDVLIFSPYAPLVAILQQSDGSFELLESGGDAQTGLVNDARIQAFAHADTDGDGKREILIAQKSFIRALHINKQNAWEILDQYNAPTSDSELTGLCALSDKSRTPLAVYDRRGKEVIVFKPGKSGAYNLDRKIHVGAIDLQAMLAAPLGGTDVPSILLASRRELTLILPDRSPIHANDKGVYESSVKDARLGALAVGNVNHDEISDVVVVDTANHFVEILTFDPEDAMVRGNKFRVFAKKQFRRRGQADPEPRWIVIDDVTSDNHDDLILIAHDRILLYPGE